MARSFNPQGINSVLPDEPHCQIEIYDEDDSEPSSDEEGGNDGVEENMGEGLEPSAHTVLNIKHNYTYVSHTTGVHIDSALKKNHSP